MLPSGRKGASIYSFDRVAVKIGAGRHALAALGLKLGDDEHVSPAAGNLKALLCKRQKRSRGFIGFLSGFLDAEILNVLPSISLVATGQGMRPRT